MGVKVRERIPGSGVFWIFIDHNGRRKAKKVGSEAAALAVAKGIEARLVLENPAVRLGRYYSKAGKLQKEIDPLSAAEVSKFLQTVLSSKYYRDYYAVLLCAIHAGLRAGELAGLQWGDLDFNGKFMTIRRNIVHRRVNTPKSGKSRRVDMSDALVTTLQELKRRRHEEGLAKGQSEIPESVFCNRDGKILDLNNLRNRALHKCLEDAKLRTIRLHDLRHTFASLLIQNGESLAYVKEQMGHSSIKVTVDVYGHLVPGANRQAMNRLPVAGGASPLAEAEKNLASTRNPDATRARNAKTSGS
jgi:integrase